MLDLRLAQKLCISLTALLVCLLSKLTNKQTNNGFRCQEKHWLQEHWKTGCADFEKEAIKLLKPNILDGKPLLPVNDTCDHCQASFAEKDESPFCLSECRHAYCWDCFFQVESKSFVPDSNGGGGVCYCNLCSPPRVYPGLIQEVFDRVDAAIETLKRSDASKDVKDAVGFYACQLLDRLEKSKYTEAARSLDGDSPECQLPSTLFKGLTLIHLKRSELLESAGVPQDLKPRRESATNLVRLREWMDTILNKPGLQ